VIVLTRVDPEKHMDRWYAVNVQPTLFDRYSVVCLWGSRRTGYQREKVISADTLEQAQELALKIVRRKMERGYNYRWVFSR
jgi:predicted DNA-binding WGR domain protein